MHAHANMYLYLMVPAVEHVAKGHLSEMSATCEQELVGTLVGSGPTCLHVRRCVCTSLHVDYIHTYARTHMLYVEFPKVPQRVCVHVVILSYLE